MGTGSFSGVGRAGRGSYDGVGTFDGGVYEDLDINGVFSAKGTLEARDLKVDGVFNCKGDLKASVIDCDGVVNIDGNLKAGLIDLDGVINLHGTKVEADKITCDGVLSVQGEVSADVIMADGFINAHEVVGDHITIKSLRKSFFLGLFVTLRKVIGHPDFSKVDIIEGTTVELQGVHANLVNGHDVKIGPHCKISRLSYTGSLHVDVDSVVEHVVGP
ncbi:MAG: hypothetical protein LBD25_03695 [Coriobacteriales bacterium]|jgi:cytoskeletal protein CcmA (bactofilin family)|nr:hypothetical protein [Coriobacteriales bacterium]